MRIKVGERTAKHEIDYFNSVNHVTLKTTTKVAYCTRMQSPGNTPDSERYRKDGETRANALSL